MNYRDFVLSAANTTEYTRTENLLRAGIGLLAEWKEYQECTIEEKMNELGDCVFWATVLRNLMGSTAEARNFDDKPFDPYLILDRLEKITRVGKSKRSDCSELEQQIVSELRKFFIQFQPVLLDVQRFNRIKLTQRLGMVDNF